MTGTYRHFYMRTEEKAGQTPTLYVGSLGRGMGFKKQVANVMGKVWENDD